MKKRVAPTVDSSGLPKATALLLPLVLLGFLLAGGCATAPAPQPTLSREEVLRRFEKSLPAHFEVMHSVVVSLKPYWWYPTIRQVSIGYSNVDRPSESYGVTCLSPLGIRLFSLSRTNGLTSGSLLLPLKDKQDTIIRAIGEAISRAYFEQIPGPAATATLKGDKLIFRQSSATGSICYTFSATRARLLAKDYYEGRRRVMTISYDNYPEGEAHPALPGRMTLKDHRYGYTLAFELRSGQ